MRHQRCSLRAICRRNGCEGVGASLKATESQLRRRDFAASENERQGENHDKFTQFVGEAFYGQMLKSMRSTVGKPAYFNGGHAEEVFQGQLDQTMAQSNDQGHGFEICGSDV